jgi:tmRNA-binding protein
MSRTRKIFLPKEEFDKLERGARTRGMTVQEYVNWAVYILEGVK